MGESSEEEAKKIVSVAAIKQTDQPISILNNRRANSIQEASIKSTTNSAQQQQKQCQMTNVGCESGDEKNLGFVDVRVNADMAVSALERSVRGIPMKFDSGSLVSPTAAKAYINRYLPREAINVASVEQKINSKTQGLDMSSESSLVGGAVAVSFTVPGNAEKISHRGSISTHPPNPSSKQNISTLIQTGPQNNPTSTSNVVLTGITSIQNAGEVYSYDSDSSTNLSLQNSVVHMPGEFVYFDHPHRVPLTPLSPPQASLNHSLGKRHHVNHSSTKTIIGENTGPQVPFKKFFQKQDDEKIHILIGATGSVATMKIPLIIGKLFKIYNPGKVSIQLVVTKRAEHFLKGLKISKDVKLWRDEDEWFGFKKSGDPALHIELQRWADIFLIAPLSANTLAKVANGICDNLLTSLLRVWNTSTPVIVAPAMNTFMYTHPVTRKHLKILQEDAPYIQILKPVEKVLVCGDIGMGGMREWIEIVEILVKTISKTSGENFKFLQENEDSETKADEDDDCEDDDYDDDDDEDDDDDDDDDDDEDDDDDDDDDEGDRNPDRDGPGHNGDETDDNHHNIHGNSNVNDAADACARVYQIPNVNQSHNNNISLSTLRTT